MNTTAQFSVLSDSWVTIELGTHVELHVSIRTGEMIRITCDCPLSADHSYRDWLELPENAALRQTINLPFMVVEHSDSRS